MTVLVETLLIHTIFIFHIISLSFSLAFGQGTRSIHFLTLPVNTWCLGPLLFWFGCSVAVGWLTDIIAHLILNPWLGGTSSPFLWSCGAIGSISTR